MDGPNVLEGYVTLDSAVLISDYKPQHLMALGQKGEIGRIKHDGIFYFSVLDLQNYIQPDGYLTIKQAVLQTGFKASYLQRLAREGRIKSVSRRRRTFLSSSSLVKLIVPEGYVRPEEAAEESAYAADYLIRLSRQGVIRRKTVHGDLYLSLADIGKFQQNPEGYLSPEEAMDRTSYSHGNLRKLAREGTIGTTLMLGIIYFSAEDIEKLTIPENFLSLKESVERSEFSIHQIKYRIRTNQIRSKIRGQKRFVSAEDLGIILKDSDTLEGKVEESS
jgi:hypothetical protein